MDILKGWVPHLEALRVHLIRVFVTWAVAAVAIFCFKERVLGWVIQPLLDAAPQANLLATGVTELFATYIRLSLWGGFLAAMPVVVVETWFFLKPALYKHERRTVGLLLTAVPLLSVAGAWFGWALLLPQMITFFMGFQAHGVVTMPHVADYVSLLVMVVGLMALAFNLPVVMALLAKIGFVRVEMFRKQRRIVAVGMLIFAGVATPTPDAMSQLLVAIPLYLLFEVGIMVSAGLQKPEKPL